MSTPTAKLLEALISKHQDFRYVMQVTYAAVKFLEDTTPEQDSALLQAYWSAALSAYARSFKTALHRHVLKPDIFTGIEGAVESHEYFMNQRNKLVAHSVNPFEAVYVGVLVDAENNMVGVGELAGRMLATTIEGFRDLNQLAKIATQHLMREVGKHKEILKTEAEQMSKSELSKLPEVKYVAPEPDKAGTARR